MEKLITPQNAIWVFVSLFLLVLALMWPIIFKNGPGIIALFGAETGAYVSIFFASVCGVSSFFRVFSQNESNYLKFILVLFGLSALYTAFSFLAIIIFGFFKVPSFFVYAFAPITPLIIGGVVWMTSLIAIFISPNYCLRFITIGLMLTSAGVFIWMVMSISYAA